jgi:3-phenylpropionate/cinnamic acid dioxygenase small subunit
MTTDWHELERLVFRLGRCLDERDFEGLRDLFTEDAEVHTPGGVSRGHDALVEQARARHTTPRGVQHLTTNVLVDQDGDTANVRANILVAFAADGAADSAPFLLGEVFRFTARRTAAGWRMTSMSGRPVWTLNAPAELAGVLAG